MTLRITPDIVEAAYNFLRVTEPFKAWRLPESDDIVFRVSGHKHLHGVYDAYPHRITISAMRNGHTDTLLMTVAHELIHLHQSLHGLDKGGEHNADFYRRATLVCRAHGWDHKAF